MSSICSLPFVSACLSYLYVCLHLCIYFVSCAYVASDVRVVERLLSGILNEDLNGVTMTPDTSTSTLLFLRPPLLLLSQSAWICFMLFLLTSPSLFSASLTSSVFHLVELLRASMDQCINTFLCCLSLTLCFFVVSFFI